MQAAWNGWATLLTPSPAWAHLACAPKAEVEAVIRAVPAHLGAVVRVLRGERCATKAGLLHEWAAALQFPWYCRDNWDSFEECLNDLSWLPARGYILLVTDADRLMTREGRDFATLMQILASASDQFAARGAEAAACPLPTSFHVVFHCEPDRERELRTRLASVGIAPTPIRMPLSADKQ